jgi:hypothetical protein
MAENAGYGSLWGDHHTPFESFYYMCITVLTIGYGDFFPISTTGQVFIIGVIIYIIFYVLPIQTNELFRLVNLKSVYQREIY